MENRSYDDIIGNGDAPYLNQLAATYGLATNYYAITHPSEPNYIAATSGDTQGIHDDEFHDVNAQNLFSELFAAGLPWRAYEQGYPGGCYTGEFANGQTDGPGSVGTYSRKHDPAVMYTSISGDPSQCSNIQPLSAFDPGSAAFTFITPNQQNDMHDGSVQQGDEFLRSFVPQIVSSPSVVPLGSRLQMAPFQRRWRSNSCVFQPIS